MCIQLVEKLESLYYYKAINPNDGKEILFKMYDYDNNISLMDVYDKFCLACDNLKPKHLNYLSMPFYVMGLYKYDDEFTIYNFDLYEYEKFFCNNKRASRKLKSVFVGINNNCNITYYLESYDGYSDLHDKSILNYCEKFAQKKIKELENLFNAEYIGMEYYI